MGAVLHFMSDRMEAPACGAKVFLCSDYTDDPRHVDCRRCRSTVAFREFDPDRYDVDIWNHEGDVIRWFRRVTSEDVDNIRREYEDDPTVAIAVHPATGS